METASEKYPYTPDGSRMWDADTPWVDPLIAAGAMGAVTSTLRFYTNVMKLGSRNPLLLARQVGSVANLTNNRFGFGVGIGWAPEEFEWCGVPYARRGERMDEMIEVIKLVLGGGMVEFHGEFYDFDKLQMSPAPSEPVPFYVGGHTEVALKRAARISDGWTSAMMTLEQLSRHHQANQRPARRIRPRRSAVRVPGRLHRQVRRGRPPRDGAGRRHRQHRDPLGFRRSGLRCPAGEEEGLAQALRGDLHPVGLAGLMSSPVHLAGQRSRDAAMARDKEAWLAVFADDAIIEDPIGPSHFDPEGKGHRGKEAIAKFYDMAIAPSRLTFHFEKTYECGNEEANVGHIVIESGGYRVIAEGVFTYKVDDEGKMVALRAYWELDHAAASAQKLSLD